MSHVQYELKAVNLSKKEKIYDFNGFLNEWKDIWEKINMERYASFYSDDFYSSGMDKKQWLESKSRINAGKDWIKIGLSSIDIKQTDGKAVITLTQNYQSSNYSDTSRKTLELTYENGKWLIHKEYLNTFTVHTGIR